MARNYSNGKLSKKSVKKFPQVFVDTPNDFASIRIADGVESKTYEINGFIFSEDSKGKVIEVQILNLSHLAKSAKKSA